MSIDQFGFTHRFVPAEDGENLTLLLLHGTGGSEMDLLPLGATIAPGAAMLSPRGKVLENGQPRFFRRLEEGVFDLDDLKYRANELAQFIREAASQYPILRNKIFALGFSNGANIAASVLLLHPGVLAGGILLRPMVPLIPEQLPKLVGVPIFIGAGRNDPLVPPVQTERLANLFREAGANVTVHWEAGGHGLTMDEARQVRVWLDAWLRPPAT